MNMNIETIPYCSIAYIRQIGSYGEGNSKIMEKLKDWAKANNLMNRKSVIFGIAHDNPQITPPENCRYDVCILLADENFPVGSDVQLGKIAGGKYAVFTVTHTAEAVQQAWVDIFPVLSENGFIKESIDVTKAYTNRFVEK